MYSFIAGSSYSSGFSFPGLNRNCGAIMQNIIIVATMTAMMMLRFDWVISYPSKSEESSEFILSNIKNAYFEIQNRLNHHYFGMPQLSHKFSVFQHSTLLPSWSRSKRPGPILPRLYICVLFDDKSHCISNCRKANELCRMKADHHHRTCARVNRYNLLWISWLLF